MTKKKKWTSWIEHTGDTCPVNMDEVVRVKTATIRHHSKEYRTDCADRWDWSHALITHYKRLISNVEAEKAKEANKPNQALKDPYQRGALSSFSPVSMVYKNHRGETAARTIAPISISFTATEYHPEAQWILHAFDMKKERYRDFALRNCNFKAATEAQEAAGTQPNTATAEVSSWTEASILAYAHYTREGLIDRIEGFKADLNDAIEVAYHHGAEEWTRLNYPDHFERFEKSAQNTTSDATEIKASEPIPTSDDTTPQPVITGVGEYETRCGDKAEILSYYDEEGFRTWRGEIFMPGGSFAAIWLGDGSVSDISEHTNVIIGPWPKPEEEVDTFFFGDQVSKKTGYQYPGKVVSIFETMAGKTRLVVECTCPEVAGMLHIYSPENLRLSHTEGDE